MKQRKVGIMGGTFDPIHHGHLIIAQCAREQFDLSEILFMPSKTPPHKSDLSVSEAVHRIAMTQLAIENKEYFQLSLMEMERGGKTYTYKTLELLTMEHPEVHFYFLMGTDSLMQFSTWRKPEVIASLCTILVANRGERPSDSLSAQIRLVKEQYGADISLLQIPAVDISSRMLRDKVRDGRSIDYYTPDKVVEYISSNHLYE